MKINTRKLLIIILIVFISAPVFAQDRVVDSAGLLSASEIQKLSNFIASIYNEYYFDLVIVTESNIGDYKPEAYADDYYDYFDYGYGSRKDGCILLHVIDSRDIVASTSGRGISILNSAAENKLFNDVITHLGSGNYYEAYFTFLTDWEEFLSLDAKGIAYRAEKIKYGFFYHWNIIILLIIWALSFVIALIVVHSWRAQMNTALSKTQAAVYVVPNSLQFSEKKDNFLYSTVTKTPKASSNSLSGGGGGGTRVSSSGATHGGGGRKY